MGNFPIRSPDGSASRSPLAYARVVVSITRCFIPTQPTFSRLTIGRVARGLRNRTRSRTPGHRRVRLGTDRPVDCHRRG